MTSTTNDYHRAADAMRRFRGMGYQPLPSRSDRKGPKVGYADYWDRLGPASWLDIPARNVQVMCGAPWRLAVIDLDGPVALEVWWHWCLYRPVPPTWEVARDPNMGRHLWFTLPDGLESCRSRDLWELQGEKHHKVELLADRKLAVAPPSRHVKTGQRYRWLPGRSPRTIARPAMIPDWLLAMPGLRAESEPLPEVPTVRRIFVPRTTNEYDRKTVLDAIPDKSEVARSWGLQLVGRPNSKGWMKCRRLGDADDRDPSAGFNVRSGTYKEPPDGRKIRFLDLPVEQGVYASWRDACNDLGSRFCA